MKSIIYIFILVLLSGCATYSSSKFISAESYETVINDNIINPSEVIITSDDLKQKYVVMGKIEVTVNKTTAFHPDPTKEIVNLALQEKAAAIGADAVIEVVYHGPRISFASWGTMEGVGTAVQYTNEKNENINNNSTLLSYDTAVDQCKELGLEEKTEKFTKCVFKLSGIEY